MKNLSVQESNHQRLKNTASSLIDVRTPAEFGAVHAERAVNYPMESFDLEQFPLSKDEEIHVICQSGGRSMKVCQKLEAAGFTKIVNVDRWNFRLAVCWTSRSRRKESHVTGKTGADRRGVFGRDWGGRWTIRASGWVRIIGFHRSRVGICRRN